MKKVFLFLSSLLFLAGCSYDDSELQQRIDDLDEKLAALAERVDNLNSELTSLQELIDGKRFISDVTVEEDGSYTLTLVTSTGAVSTIRITNGEDGHSPKIGIKQDSDGKYYWTLDGEYILDDNNGKLPVAGEDGTTPQFKIEQGYWYVSYDKGASWQECGKAAADAEPALFKSVTTSEDGKLVYITLQDGTVLTFELYVQFGIAFETTTGALQVGGSVSVPFTLTGADENTQVEAIANNDWKAEVRLDEERLSGTVEITAPADSSTGKVIVLANDGGDRTLMRTLTFVAGVLNISTSSVEATAGGGQVSVEVETDMDYEVVIPEEAQSWVSVIDTRSDLRQEMLNFKVEANTQAAPRQTLVELQTNGATLETILIFQEGEYDPATMVLRVEAAPYTGTNAKYSNMVYLPLYGAVNVTVNWGDGSSETVEKSISTAASMVSHTYETAGTYFVTVDGSAAQINGRLTPKAVQPAITQLIQWGDLKPTSLQSAFSGNTSLTSVPLPPDGAFAAVTTVEDMFVNCTALTSVPETLLAQATELTDITTMFEGCTSLESIPENFFEKNTKVTEASGLFTECTKLTTVPAGILAPMTALEDVSSLFKNCTSLTSVPAGLLDNQPAVTTLASLFYGCSALTSVPAGIFDKQTAVTTVSSCFYGCSALRELPDGLFDKQTGTTNISSLFKGCSSLVSVPSGLFDSFSKATNMANLFSGCASLKSLPADLFAKLTAVTQAGYLYEGCTGLTQFPSLKNCTALKTVNALWKDCSTLVSAPDDYFPESVKSGTTLAYLFQNCSALENVPAGLFRNFESVTIITQMFENCTSLRSLPVEMFDNMRKITTATSAFNGCSAFTGESPYTMVEGEKVHLYERSTANGFSAVTKYTDCFEGCTQMADYANIPQAWGGISDGTKAKPTLTLSMAPQAGAEYYRFDITIRGTEVKQSKFVLGTTEIVQKRLAEFDGDYERLCNRYGTTFNSSVVSKINSETGHQVSSGDLEADTDYTLVVLASNAHGTTIATYESRTAEVPAGDADFERYIGTWTVTSTSAEKSGAPQTFTIQIEPYRVNESFRVSGWGITTMGNADTAPFLMDYADGKVSISTKDYYGMVGLYYVYLKYRFYDPEEESYFVWTTDSSLATGEYGSDGSITIECGKFTNPANGKEYTVSGMDYFLYSGGGFYESMDLFKPDYLTSDYSIGPYRLTRASGTRAVQQTRTSEGFIQLEQAPRARVMTQPGASRVNRK